MGFGCALYILLRSAGKQRASKNGKKIRFKVANVPDIPPTPLPELCRSTINKALKSKE